MRRIILPMLLLLCFVVLAEGQGQDVDFREELRFAEALRKRKDYDRALEVLDKLGRGAPPDLAKELALEKARLRVDLAGNARDTARRLRLYKEAGQEFQKFIDENPGHPAIAGANLEVARVLNLTGRTQFNQALLNRGKERREMAVQARATLVQAATKLAAAVKALEEQKAKLTDPDTVPDARKKKEAADAIAKMDRTIK